MYFIVFFFGIVWVLNINKYSSDFNCNESKYCSLELKMEFWHKKPFSICFVHKSRKFSNFEPTLDCIMLRNFRTVRPIFPKIAPKVAQNLKEKSLESSRRGNFFPRNYRAKRRGGGRIPPPPPAHLGLRVSKTGKYEKKGYQIHRSPGQVRGWSAERVWNLGAIPRCARTVPCPDSCGYRRQLLLFPTQFGLFLSSPPRWRETKGSKLRPSTLTKTWITFQPCICL